MNIVILSGGTGSIALQKGLYALLDENLDGINTKVIVNAYDNGLSTGAVRQVMNGKILGPSDVRKNQTTRLELENPSSPWLKLLNIRFTKPSDEAKAFCHSAVDTLDLELYDMPAADKYLNGMTNVMKKTQFVREAIDAYFRSPLANKIDYNDFSLANIIYAGFAAANGNSLRAAAKIMASIMGIGDNVILNDDTSLFLGAITKSGKRITDEGDIVSWGSHEDPIVDVFFTDHTGFQRPPLLCDEARDAIVNADLIILSAGTQWSSLIPTYTSIGFDSAIRNTKADIVMVMNRQPDKDSPGQSASDIVRILTDRYFPTKKIKLILDNQAPDLMRVLDEDARERVLAYEHFDMSDVAPKSEKVHHPHKLAHAVGRMYFSNYIKSDCYVFDYDDTLVGRGNVFPKSSKANVRNLRALSSFSPLAICTGNSIKAISLPGLFDESSLIDEKPIDIIVYADGGINKYSYTAPRMQGSDEHDFERKQVFIECVNPTAAFSQLDADKIVDTLRAHHIPLAKIENRGNAMIAIKPIENDYRPMVLDLVNLVIDVPGVVAKESGRTTIEIAKYNLSKVDAILDLQSQGHRVITYVGDELDNGNDAVVRSIKGVQCLHVKNPAHTAFFTSILTGYLSSITKH